MIKKKILILDDYETLLYELKTNISKFEVITATTIAQALKKLQDNEISFIVADVRLKKGKKGQAIFDKLFKKGQSIPGIVFSAYVLNEETKKDLEDYGIIDYIEKGGSETKLSKRLEQVAEKLLKDPKMRFFAVAKKLRELNLLQRKISCVKVKKTKEKKVKKTKEKDVKITLEKKLKKIYKGKYTIDEENKIKEKMIQICNKHLRPEGSRPYPFPEVGIA